MLFAAAALFAQPSLADACINGVEITTDDYARMVAKAENHLEAGQFGKAKQALGRGDMPTAALKQRAADIRAVLNLRMSTKPKELAAAAKHFKARSEAKTDDVRFQAWLAEALLATGSKTEARTILVGLHERDLLPDAYAYRALATLSTGGERYTFWKACRARTKNKSLCELPDEVATAITPAPRS
jgi:hypothetical protein